jgi:hypothetical protein
MHEPMPPGDHNSESPEEARRRIELHLVWAQLVREHVFAKEDSVAGLAGQLKAWQALESKDPSIGEDLLPFYEEAASRIENRIRQACLRNDWKLLGRLSEAAEANAKGKSTQKLFETGYALKAFWPLFLELGHPPNQDQLRERVERLRKQDGFENPKVSVRHWDRAFEDISQLYREE